MASFAEIHKNTIIDTYNSDNNASFNGDECQTDVDKILEIEYSRYIRNKILYECLVECIDDLEPEIGDKLEGIIYNTKLKQYMKLDIQSLLGLTLNNDELSYHEGEEVKTLLQKKVWDKKTKTYEEFKTITSKDLDQLIGNAKPVTMLRDPSLSREDQSVIAYKNKLVKVQQLFMDNVLTRNKLLEDMLNLRLVKVPEMCDKTSRYCKAVIESNHLKVKIAEFKMKLDIFMEIPKAIEAYHQLLKDIKKQQDYCEVSIEKLKESKRKYQNVSGREFEEILKSYLMYKNSLDKINQMYQLVK